MLQQPTEDAVPRPALAATSRSGEQRSHPGTGRAVPEGPPRGAISAIDARGVRKLTSAAELKAYVTAGRPFWLDVCGAEPSVAREFLLELGVEETGIDTALRFGQTGRITISGEGVRGVTWVSDPPHQLMELHFRSSSTYVFTIWNGDSRILDEARRQFVDRVTGIQEVRYHATAIILQLLNGTLYSALGSLDEAIHTLTTRIRERPGSMGRKARPCNFAR